MAMGEDHGNMAQHGEGNEVAAINTVINIMAGTMASANKGTHGHIQTFRALAAKPKFGGHNRNGMVIVEDKEKGGAGCSTG